MYSKAPSVDQITSNSILLSWHAWTEDDGSEGPLDGYTLYQQDSFGSISSFSISKDVSNFESTGLEIYTTYNFSVAAAREGTGGEGSPGPTAFVRTQCRGNIWE